MKRLGLFLALSLSACGGGTTTTPAGGGGTSGGSAANGNGNGNGAGGSVTTTTTPEGFTTTNLEYRADGTIVLGPGFLPTPVVVAGVVGGPNEASPLGTAVGAYCYGYIPDEPQHVVELTATVADLRVVVDTFRAGSGGSNDATLFVRLPGGQIYCDDDGGGDLQPALDLYNVGPGRIEIFVGAYSSGAMGGAYKLGLSENPSFMYTDLR